MYIYCIYIYIYIYSIYTVDISVGKTHGFGNQLF